MQAVTALERRSLAVNSLAEASSGRRPPRVLHSTPNSLAPPSEGLEGLVKRALTFFDSDREVARRCLNDASVLLDLQDSCSSGPSARSEVGSKGLSRWQIDRALNYIEANLGSKVVSGDLANLVALSPSHFFRAFKQSMGFPPMAYVAARRIEKAKCMMASTRKKLVAIALECGFADQPHLNRSFRREVGLSPGQWRRRNAKPLDSKYLSGKAQSADALYTPRPWAAAQEVS